ncbi:MAG: hypothetical protein ACOVO1_06285 [Chitinophagaceae bacterium]
MRKIVFLTVFMVLCAFLVNAQNEGSIYKSAIGFKFYPGAVSYKTFVKSNTAIEANAYFWQYGARITALYEYHGDINDVSGLKWYAGFGTHVGFWNDTWKKEYPTRANGVAIGADGVLGLDYKISGAPINLSLDWQPSFNVIGYNYFEGGWGGLAIRYTF